MGTNIFLPFAPIGPGASIGPILDLVAASPPSGLGPDMTFICKGEFEGSIAIEGSTDQLDWGVVTQFDAGVDADGRPGPSLELSPKRVQASVRYLRTITRAAVRAGTQTQISVAGEAICCCNVLSKIPVAILVNGQPGGTPTNPSCNLPCSPAPVIDFVLTGPVNLFSYQRQHPDVGGSIPCPVGPIAGPQIIEFGAAAATVLPSPANVVRLRLNPNNLKLATYLIEIVVDDPCNFIFPLQRTFGARLSFTSGPCPPGP